MPIRSARLAPGLAAALLLSVAAMNPAAAAPCDEQIAETLRELSVPQEDVKSIDLVRRGKGGKSSSNYTQEAFVKLNSCSGNVVIDMTRYCMVQQTYTTGDCSIGGMPNY
ncbi:MAG: hypothetical protein ACFCUT_03015 [Kiloniellaceae bacterium]